MQIFNILPLFHPVNNNLGEKATKIQLTHTTHINMVHLVFHKQNLNYPYVNFGGRGNIQENSDLWLYLHIRK